MAGQDWEIYVVDEVLEWVEQLDDATHARVVQAIDALAGGGPGLGRPLVDTIVGDKAGQWNAWYREAIPLAEDRYDRYLKERQAEEGRL
jgi:hypothetical protein